jgi:hypothetical protein
LLKKTGQPNLGAQTTSWLRPTKGKYQPPTDSATGNKPAQSSIDVAAVRELVTSLRADAEWSLSEYPTVDLELKAEEYLERIYL